MKLFGTDGIRGKAGSAPLEPETVARVGAAIVKAKLAAAGPKGPAPQEGEEVRGTGPSGPAGKGVRGAGP
jgi:hypothetical protein